MTKNVEIVGRQLGDGYSARAKGVNVSASSTASVMTAVERVALKIKLGVKNAERIECSQAGISIRAVGENKYIATWEEPDLKPEGQC